MQQSEMRLWKALPTAKMAFVDGSYLYASYLLKHWDDEVDESDEDYINQVSATLLNDWIVGQDENEELHFEVELQDGSWRVAKLAKGQPTRQERLY